MEKQTWQIIDEESELTEMEETTRLYDLLR